MIGSEKAVLELALSQDERASLNQVEDMRSWLTLAIDWGLIGAALALVAVWSNP